MRGENCMDASVSVISRIAKTIDTTVMIDVGDARQDHLGNLRIRVRGKQHVRHPGIQCRKRLLAFREHIPGAPSTKAIASGRTRKPPRNA